MHSYNRSQKNKLSPNPSYPSSKRQKFPDQIRHTSSNRLSFNQKDVFKWYEENTQQYEGEEIFSPEWKDRLLDWEDRFQYADSDQIASYKNYPRELDIGLFFQFHPVAAFSLWHVLQACYELDMNICGNNGMSAGEIEERKRIIGWRNLRIFDYLQAEEIMKTWQNKLFMILGEVEKTQRSDSKVEREDMANRLYGLTQDVQSLENALRTLESVFKKSEDLDACQWMLELVRHGVGTRCRAVERIFDQKQLLRT